ncbi:hypothetical protein FQR65_LT15352 [Abscondita terminalis]|nr:hypothetical protein FQR65_LT15352 [Abscondita terminalis]
MNTGVKYIPNSPISNEDMNALIEAARLAPSSMGLTHGELVVFKDQKEKELISKFFMETNINKVKDSSLLIIISGLTLDFYKQNDFQPVLERKTKYITKTLEEAIALKDVFKNYLGVHPVGDIQDYVTTALMVENIALQATELGYGSTIMQGFNDKELTQELKDKNLINTYGRALLAIAIGKTDKDFEINKLSSKNKIRPSIDEFAKIV